MEVADCQPDKEVNLRTEEEREEQDEHPGVVLGFDLDRETTEPM